MPFRLWLSCSPRTRDTQGGGAQRSVDMESAELTKLYELLRHFSTAMLVTHDRAGSLRARPMALVEVESSCRLWFITSDETAKTHEIEKNTQVLVVCQDKEICHLSINGHAHLEKDRSHLDRIWRESFRVWFPEGKDDPSIVLIAVDPLDGEYWDNRGVQGIKYLVKSAGAYLSGKTPKVDEEEHGRVILMP